MALAVVGLTAFVTWLAYSHVVLVEPAAVQPVIGLGLASVFLESVLALWSIRVFATLEADQTNRRMQFCATAVHDLRQPLQAATLFIDHLLHSNLDSQQLKAAKSLELSLQSVRHILDVLMDTTALDAGAVQAQSQSFSLTALLHALDAEFTPRAIALDLRFCLFCPSNDVVLESDPQLVRQIVRNLLVHALAQTRYGGVLLGVRQRKGQVCIQVWDTRTDVQADPGKKTDRGLIVANRLAAQIHASLLVDSRRGVVSVSTLSLSRGSLPPMQDRPEVQV